MTKDIDNVYEMYIQEGSVGFWIASHDKMSKICLRVVAVDPFEGDKAAYYGNPEVRADVYLKDSAKLVEMDAVVAEPGMGLYRRYDPKWHNPPKLRDLANLPIPHEAMERRRDFHERLAACKGSPSYWKVVSSLSKAYLVEDTAIWADGFDLGARWDVQMRAWWVDPNDHEKVEQAIRVGFRISVHEGRQV